MKHIIALSFLFGAAVAAAGGIDPTELIVRMIRRVIKSSFKNCAASFVKIKRCQNQARRWQKTCVMSSNKWFVMMRLTRDYRFYDGAIR